MSFQLSPYTFITGEKKWSMVLLDDSYVDLPLVQYSDPVFQMEHLGWAFTPDHEVAIFTRDRDSRRMVNVTVWGTDRATRMRILEIMDSESRDPSRATSLHLSETEWYPLVGMRASRNETSASGESSNGQRLSQSLHLPQRSNRVEGISQQGDSPTQGEVEEPHDAHEVAGQEVLVPTSTKGKQREPTPIARCESPLSPMDDESEYGAQPTPAECSYSSRKDKGKEREKTNMDNTTPASGHQAGSGSSSRKGKEREVPMIPLSEHVLDDATSAAINAVIDEDSDDGSEFEDYCPSDSDPCTALPTSTDEKENVPWEENEPGPSSRPFTGPIRTGSRDQKDGEKGKWVCDVCGATFCSESTLQRHKEEIHGDAVFVCGVCKKSFSRYAGTNTKRHPCPYPLEEMTKTEYFRLHPEKRKAYIRATKAAKTKMEKRKKE